MEFPPDRQEPQRKKVGSAAIASELRLRRRPSEAVADTGGAALGD